MKLTINQSEFFLGIDVGKTDLFCYIIGNTESFNADFKNTVPGISRLIKWVLKISQGHVVHTCMEATGHYSRLVSQTLIDALNGDLYVVNPRQVKAFSNRRLRRNKSDKADAKLIAQFLVSEQAELTKFIPKTKEEQSIQEISNQKEYYTREIVKFKTQLQCRDILFCKKSIERMIKALEKECEKLALQLDKLIAKNIQKKHNQSLLLTVPGLATTTVNLLIAQLPSIDQFSSPRQLAAWIGVTPKHYESGTSGRSYTPITKMGSAPLRSGLFLPAMSAMTHNPVIKTFANRLRENGKKGKVVVVACVRKLIHIIYAILKKQEPFNPNMKTAIVPS